MEETTEKATPIEEGSAEKIETAKVGLEHILGEADRMRQELSLQMHLAKMDAQDEFAKLDKHYESFKVKSKEMADVISEFGEELGEDLQASFKNIAAKFKEQYENIKNKM